MISQQQHGILPKPQFLAHLARGTDSPFPHYLPEDVLQEINMYISRAFGHHKLVAHFDRNATRYGTGIATGALLMSVGAFFYTRWPARDESWVTHPYSAVLLIVLIFQTLTFVPVMLYTQRMRTTAADLMKAHQRMRSFMECLLNAGYTECSYIRLEDNVWKICQNDACYCVYQGFRDTLRNTFCFSRSSPLRFCAEHAGRLETTCEWTKVTKIPTAPCGSCLVPFDVPRRDALESDADSKMMSSHRLGLRSRRTVTATGTR